MKRTRKKPYVDRHEFRYYNENNQYYFTEINPKTELRSDFLTMDAKYEALFTPWKIGNVEIKNRIVLCPMGGTSLFGWMEHTGNHFDHEAAKFFLEKAKIFTDKKMSTEIFLRAQTFIYCSVPIIISLSSLSFP